MALDKLYDDVIMDHINHARNFHALQDAHSKAEAVSRLCGDSVTVYLKFDGECIRDIAFQCSSCAIAMASASIMTQSVRGKTRAEAQALSTCVTAQIEQKRSDDTARFDGNQAAIFAALREFPQRRTCATVGWYALAAALRGQEEVTEVG